MIKLKALKSQRPRLTCANKRIIAIAVGNIVPTIINAHMMKMKNRSTGCHAALDIAGSASAGAQSRPATRHQSSLAPPHSPARSCNPALPIHGQRSRKHFKSGNALAKLNGNQELARKWITNYKHLSSPKLRIGFFEAKMD